MTAPGKSYADESSWPKLDARYLDDEQIEYEVKLRKLDILISRDETQRLTSESLHTLNTEIQQDSYLPSALYHFEHSDPKFDVNAKLDEVKNCRDGANLLKDLNDHQTVLHRATHLFYQLKGIQYDQRPELEEKKINIYSTVRKAIVNSMTQLDLIQSFQTARSRETAPTTTQSNEHNPNVTQTEFQRVGTPLSNSTFESTSHENIGAHNTVTTEPVLLDFMNPPITTHTGTKPRTTEYSIPTHNIESHLLCLRRRNRL